jgi:hypothetical protein
MHPQVLDLAKTMKLLLASADARAAAAAATKSGCQFCLSRLLGQGSINEHPPCAQQQVRAVCSGPSALSAMHVWLVTSNGCMKMLFRCTVWCSQFMLGSTPGLPIIFRKNRHLPQVAAAAVADVLPSCALCSLFAGECSTRAAATRAAQRTTSRSNYGRRCEGSRFHAQGHQQS